MRTIFALSFVLLALLAGSLHPSAQISAQGGSSYQYAYVTQQPGQAPEMILVDPDGITSVAVPIPTNIVVVEALLSPNGEWLALLPQSDLIIEAIVLYAISTGEIRLLTVDMGLGRGHPIGHLGKASLGQWSPDSRYLAYISYQNAQHDVFVYAMDTDSTVNLTNDAAGHGSLSWGANYYLAFASESCVINGCNVSVDIFDFFSQTQLASVGVPQRHSIQLGNGLCTLQLSPDNARASFVRHCTSNPYQTTKEVYIADFLSSSLITLTNFTEIAFPVTNAPPGDPGFRFAAYDITWSDDQTLLVGASVGVQQPGMTEERTYKYDINDITNPTVLLDGSMAQQWAENPVSGQMAFLSTVGYLEVTSAQTQLADWDGNQLSIVGTYPAGCNLLWSPDYRFLAYSRHDTPFSGCDEALTGFHFLDTTDHTMIEYSASAGFVFPAGWVQADNTTSSADAGS